MFLRKPRVLFLWLWAGFALLTLVSLFPETAAGLAGQASAVYLRLADPYLVAPGQGQALTALRTRVNFTGGPVLRGPVLTGSEALERRAPAPGGILVYTPWEMRRIPETDRGSFLAATAWAAVRLGVRVVVEASLADGAQTSPEGQRAAEVLRKHGILRVVIFDGAHHLPAMSVPADVLLVPVMQYQGEEVAVHGYLRDALPVNWLSARIEHISAAERPVLVTMPRLGGYLKDEAAMGQLGRDLWGLLAGGKGGVVQESPRGRGVFREKAPVYPVSARDLLLLRFFPGKKGLFPARR